MYVEMRQKRTENVYEHTTVLRKRKFWIMAAFTYCGLEYGDRALRRTCVMYITACAVARFLAFVCASSYLESHQKRVSTGRAKALGEPS